LIAQTFSPSQALCESGICAFSVNGIPLYYDNAHVTLSSADWAAMLRDQFKNNGRKASMSCLEKSDMAIQRPAFPDGLIKTHHPFLESLRTLVTKR
jgi:hypothetical protein